MNPYQKWNKYWWRYWWYECLSIPYRIKTVVQWLPVIWGQGECDYSYLYRLLAYKFERMERRAIRTADWSNQKRELLICKNLMKRLAADEYLPYPDYARHPYFGNIRSVKQWSDYEQSMQRQDKELFCKIFLRKVDTWWD